DGFGAFNKTIYFNNGTQYTWDLTAATANQLEGGIASPIGYNLHFNFNNDGATRTVLINASATARVIEFNGNITGGNANTRLHLISQGNQQMVFSGEVMDWTGYARLRFGSEVVLAAANSDGV